MNKTYQTNSPLPQATVTADDLNKIRKYTRRDFTAEEIYTFPILLCDNEVDRDLEMFGTEGLDRLAELFVGKTGIFDHDPSGKNQTARIYKAECRTDPTQKTQTGETYTAVYAYAYMPRIPKNADLIAEIDSGIKKETSVGCAVRETRCSICGADVQRERCAHRKGEIYDGKLCCHILCDPTDAYEWSFVAVPAQRNAGVIKSFREKETEESMDTIYKALRNADKPLTLTTAQQAELCSRLDALEADAALGKAYRAELCAETLRTGMAAMQDMDGDALRAVCERASVPELKAMQKSFGTLLNKETPIPLQLVSGNNDAESDRAFRI